MSDAAISPVGPVQALAPNQAVHAMSGLSPVQDHGLQAVQLAQQAQVFSMLMQNTQSSLMSPALQAPKDDDEDEG